MHDTARVLEHVEGHFGLRVVSSEELETPPVRLTYLGCCNCYLQLVEPLHESAAVVDHLRTHGEGLHHIFLPADERPAFWRQTKQTLAIGFSGSSGA